MLPCPRGNLSPGHGTASGSPLRPPAPAAPDASVWRPHERPLHLIRCVISRACPRLPETFRNKLRRAEGSAWTGQKALGRRSLGTLQLLRDERMTPTCPAHRVASARWLPLATVHLDSNHELRRSTGCCPMGHESTETARPPARVPGWNVPESTESSRQSDIMMPQSTGGTASDGARFHGVPVARCTVEVDYTITAVRSSA